MAKKQKKGAVTKHNDTYRALPKPADAVEQAKQQSTRWWLAPENQVADLVNNVVEGLSAIQASRQANSTYHMRLYDNNLNATYRMPGGRMSSFQTFQAAASGRLQVNMCETVCDAAQAKIAKSTPVPLIVTDNGSFRQQKKARLLNKYIAGEFSRLRVDETMQDAFRDCTITYAGVVKVFVEDGEVKLKRCRIDDIWVDDEQAADGKPREMHHTDVYDRFQLAELYAKDPDKVDKIMRCPAIATPDSSDVADDLVMVRESWHLPSGRNSRDGRHCITIENCDLLDEEWKRSTFPFVFLRWKNRPLSFYGISVCEQLYRRQYQINQLCYLITESIKRVCKPHIMIPNGSNIVPAHVGWDIATVLKTSGGAIPQFLTPDPIPESIYQWLESLKQDCWACTGLSQLSGQSQKPTGLNAGAALREFQDIETGRFELVGKRYEQAYCDLAVLIIEATRELAAQGIKPRTKFVDDDVYEEIKWKDASLADDKYHMEVFPVSSLPNSPSGRMAMVQELYSGGWLDKSQALDLFGFPDLNKTLNLEVAKEEDAKRAVDSILWEGKWTVPNDLMDLQKCAEIAQSTWLNKRDSDIPQANLDMLIRFMTECQDMSQAQQAQAAAALAAAAPQQPPGGGSPPPNGNPPQ